MIIMCESLRINLFENNKKKKIKKRNGGEGIHHLDIFLQRELHDGITTLVEHCAAQKELIIFTDPVTEDGL